MSFRPTKTNTEILIMHGQVPPGCGRGSDWSVSAMQLKLAVSSESLLSPPRCDLAAD